MKRKQKNKLLAACCLAAAFLAWTCLVATVDRQPIGPCASSVGFATLNAAVHRLVGVHWGFYTLTDWLGLVPIVTALGFACLGIRQWCVRRSLRRVDRSLLLLGVFYLAVMAVYVFFEAVTVNYRPVLIEGGLEASYPSSTTMLATCVMPTAAMQLRARIGSRAGRGWIPLAAWLFTVGMVMGRVLAGVHWITDILGGLLISAALVTAYGALAGQENT